MNNNEKDNTHDADAPGQMNPSNSSSSCGAAGASAEQASANHDIADRLSLWLSSSLDDHLRQDKYRKHIRAWLDFNGNGTFALDSADATRYRYIATLMDWRDIERMCWSTPAESAEDFKRGLDKYIDGKLATISPWHAACLVRIRSAGAAAKTEQAPE